MTVTASQAVPRTEVVGRSILVIAALTTAVMAGIAIGQLGGAASQTLITETTSALSLAVFTGLFALLAWRPLSYPGVLELCFGLKLGITLIALGQREAEGAWLALVVNGLIALGLLVAYVLLRCYRAWHRQTFVKDTARKHAKPQPGASSASSRKKAGEGPEQVEPAQQQGQPTTTRPITTEAPVQPRPGAGKGNPGASEPDLR